MWRKIVKAARQSLSIGAIMPFAAYQFPKCLLLLKFPALRGRRLRLNDATVSSCLLVENI